LVYEVIKAQLLIILSYKLLIISDLRHISLAIMKFCGKILSRVKARAVMGSHEIPN